ncbi:MAG: pantetheine-phosphate adenylyltransferase [Bacilli bacterium]|nr:pantetheine-phosphate adenylyltransferase [Bacilli bacterium]
MKTAIYPGSFDPITNGHLDVLKRSLEVFDKVIVLVAINPDKSSRFSPAERVEMIKEAVKDLKNVEVDSTTGLTVEYAKKHGAKHLIRGLRAVTDFEYEFQLAVANEFADSDIDMVFFMARGETTYITSSMIMELNKNGVDVSTLVPNSVLKRLK